jgi:hypothetical protein
MFQDDREFLVMACHKNLTSTTKCLRFPSDMFGLLKFGSTDRLASSISFHIFAIDMVRMRRPMASMR